MSKQDAMLLATTGVGILVHSQDAYPVKVCTRDDPSLVAEETRISASSTNIIISAEVRQPPGLPTIMEDPNIAGTIAELVASHQSGETFQVYEQHCMAAGHYQGFPAPAFFRQAGESSEHKAGQVSLPKINMQLESDEMPPITPVPKKKLKKILMAKKLEDRVAYQRMCN